MYKLGISLNMH